MERISIVAMDLDGTLLGKDKKISEENIKALKACRDRGIKVVLASGRSFESVRTFATGMGVECGIISCNGARMDETPHGPVLVEEFIPEKTARRVFEILVEDAVYFESYTPGKIYMTDGFVERFHSHEARVMDLDGYRLEYIDSTERMRQEALGCTYKFVVFSPDQDVLRRTAEKMRNLGWVDVTSSWGDNVELVKKDTGKGKTLVRYAEMQGISAKEIMAFGDQVNDLDMLSVSGWPVAMENAVDELKEMARIIAPHHDRSGVGKVIFEYALDERKQV